MFKHATDKIQTSDTAVYHDSEGIRQAMAAYNYSLINIYPAMCLCHRPNLSQSARCD